MCATVVQLWRAVPDIARTCGQDAIRRVCGREETVDDAVWRRCWYVSVAARLVAYVALTRRGYSPGIVALGTHVFESLLLWQIPAFLDRLAVHLTPAEQPRAPKANRRLAQRRLQAHRCLGATTVPAASTHLLPCLPWCLTA